MISAKYGSKKFQVSNKQVYTPNGLSFSEEIEIEETEVSGKKPTVKIKGIKLQSLDFDVKLDSRFVDVLKEIKSWKSLLLGKKSNNFTLGKYTIGKFFLTKVSTKNITINKNGEYTGATISLSFAEDSTPATKASTSKTSKVQEVKNSVLSKNITKDSYIIPKSGTRWYLTAEGALKKSGKSGKAYQRVLKVTYTYSKNGKIVCVNPQGYGWMKVEDVTFAPATAATTLHTVK